MSASPFAGILVMRIARDGTITLVFADGSTVTGSLGRNAFAASSGIEVSTYLPLTSELHLLTTRGDDVVVELPRPDELSPIEGRPTIYLDQNHWSTLTAALHQPHRVGNPDELAAAKHLIDLSQNRQIILPMSSGHMSETCKQLDAEARYRRALTIGQLSSGWQFADPLWIRQVELQRALANRYSGRLPQPMAPVSLAPNAVHTSRTEALRPVSPDLPDEAQWAVHVIRCIGGNLDVMLDAEHTAMGSMPEWAADFQRFAAFLADNPTGPEIKRLRTHAKFVADIRVELAEATLHSGITASQMRGWTLNHSEPDLTDMPALGLYREVLHEKLCDPGLRWEQNDLVDMIYLTAAVGYCDHVVGERAHIAHIRGGLRRLGRTASVHNNLRTLVADLRQA